MSARDRLWAEVDGTYRINGMVQAHPGDLSTLLLDYDRVRAQLNEARRTRTLGGPITGRRVPAPPGAWGNAAVGGPVQEDWTGRTEES